MLVRFHPHQERNVLLIQPAPPILANKLAIPQNALNTATAELTDETFEQGYSFMLAGVTFFVQHQPIDRNRCTFVHNAQRQEVKILLPSLPVGAIQRELKGLLFKTKQIHDESRQCIVINMNFTKETL